MDVTSQQTAFVDAARIAQILAKRDGVPISAAGVRAAARRGAIPFDQERPRSAMRFSVGAVLESGYTPVRPKEAPIVVRCSNPRCAGSFEISGYARRNYRSHFCSWECKYATPGAWNPGGGHTGPLETSWRPRFLAAIGEGMSVAEAARCAGVAPATPYRQRRADAAFRAAWEEAAPAVNPRHQYWQSDRSAGHRARLSDAYESRRGRSSRPPLERALCSPSLAEKRERRRVERHQSRREEIASALRSDSMRSNRSIATELRRDARIVGIVRRQLEDAGDIPVRAWGARRQTGYPNYPHHELGGIPVAAARAAATSRATTTGSAAKRSARKRDQLLALIADGATLKMAAEQVGWTRRHAQRVAREAGVAPRAPGRPPGKRDKTP
jgi:hypothetical protein